MYLFMYAALIKLRYKAPDVKRPFKIPGGKLGAWIVGAWGFIAMVFVFIVALFPPSQISGSGLTTPEYVAMLLIGTIIVFVIPLIIYRSRKDSWRPDKNPELAKEHQNNKLISDDLKEGLKDLDKDIDKDKDKGDGS